MKIADILAHVEIQRPTSTKECRSGWTMDQVADRLAANPDPKRRVVSRNWAGPGQEPLELGDDPDSEVASSPKINLKEKGEPFDHQGVELVGK
jgi:hypothetical protein